MRSLGLLVGLFAVAAAAFAPPAAADSWKHERRHDVGGEECNYSYKENRNGFKESRKCRTTTRFRGGPPPWGQPHGYRSGGGYAPPFGIDSGRCNRDLIGGVLGGAAGGLLGSQVGQGSGNTAAIIGGAIVGVLAGGSVGHSMDRVDQACMGQILEYAPNDRNVVWNSPERNVRYQVVPVDTFQYGGRYCREYRTIAVIGGQRQEVYGTACRQPDGSWEVVG